MEFPFDEGKSGWSEKSLFRTNGKRGMASASINRRIGWYYSGGCCCCLVGVALMFWRSGMEAEDLDVPGELQKMDVSKAYLKLNTGSNRT